MVLQGAQAGRSAESRAMPLRIWSSMRRLEREAFPSWLNRFSAPRCSRRRRRRRTGSSASRSSRLGSMQWRESGTPLRPRAFVCVPELGWCEDACARPRATTDDRCTSLGLGPLPSIAAAAAQEFQPRSPSGRLRLYRDQSCAVWPPPGGRNVSADVIVSRERCCSQQVDGGLCIEDGMS